MKPLIEKHSVLNKPITVEQKSRLKILLTKTVEESLTQLAENNVLNEKSFKHLRPKEPKVAELVKSAIMNVCGNFATNIRGPLKLISGGRTLLIPPTKGKRTIVQAKEVFAYLISDSYKNKNQGLSPEPRPSAKVQVYRITKDTTYSEVFGALADNLNQIYLTQDQIITFVEQYPELMSKGHTERTLFLFKRKGKFYPLQVRDYFSRQLFEAWTYEFSNSGLFHPSVDDQVVVLQPPFAN